MYIISFYFGKQVIGVHRFKLRYMKNFLSFLLASMMVFVTSASAQQGQVILNSNTNYEVQIDGRTYREPGTTTINDLAPGAHTVAVYQVVSRGIFGIGKKRNQLAFEQFNLANDNVSIAVSQNGQIRISKDNYNGKNNSKNRDGDYNGNTNNGSGKYGKSEGKGKGHKYGHYKNKKNKKNKKDHKGEHDDDDHRDEHRDNRRNDNN